VTGQGALVASFVRGQDQQQPWQVMATIDQADIRGSEPHNQAWKLGQQIMDMLAIDDEV